MTPDPSFQVDSDLKVCFTLRNLLLISYVKSFLRCFLTFWSDHILNSHMMLSWKLLFSVSLEQMRTG